ncbi:MAG: Tol-Pal system beta propeller repeat protein TolB, partial [Gammaproteobacteria bacterium]|nr:Tol-Pal system beta propeller repeat protein TolB [Gammaproteobacteria bacterium]
MKYWRVVAGSLALLVAAGNASADLEITITSGVERGIPIAIVPFSDPGEPPLPQDVAAVIKADLVRSGRFEAREQADFLAMPHEAAQVKFKNWQLIKVDAVVVGRVRASGGGNYSVQFQLLDAYKGSQLAGYRYQVSAGQLRRVAHQIADIIYEKMLNQPGAFDTRIAYVTAQGQAPRQQYLLYLADSDGYNPRSILESSEPIMSPAWSPDGRYLAYVSFEKKRSMVFVQDIAARTRKRIAAFDGLNSAPAWAPNGRELALVLSRDGNPEIYRYTLASGALARLTRHHAIDTEPAWSPDGRSLVFTSDRAGTPQLYRMDKDGNNVERLTFQGRYNTRPMFSADGQTLTLVHGEQGSGSTRVAVLHLASRALHALTGGPYDESPSFAPNGQMILYASERDGRGVLAAVSTDGRVQQQLKFQ